MSGENPIISKLIYIISSSQVLRVLLRSVDYHFVMIDDKMDPNLILTVILGNPWHQQPDVESSKFMALERMTDEVKLTFNK